MLEKGHFAAGNAAFVQMPRLYLWQRHGFARIVSVKAAACRSLPAWALQGARITPCCSLGGDSSTQAAVAIPEAPIPPQASPLGAASAQTPAAPEGQRVRGEAGL